MNPEDLAGREGASLDRESASSPLTEPQPDARGASEPQPPSSRHRREPEHWLSVVQWLSASVVIAVFVITFITQAFQIPSESMEKTLLIGDYLLVDKVHFAQPGALGRTLPYEPIRRGDIIVFRYPVNPTQHFVKRVIGLPGDYVHLREGRVYINGEKLQDQAYAEHESSGYDSYRDDFPNLTCLSPDVNSSWCVEMRRSVQHGELVVPADHYFVLGDNRDHSSDSRYWGFVPRANIIGRPLVIYWSMNQPDLELLGVSNGKLSHLVYTLTHVLENARWGRSMRLVY